MNCSVLITIVLLTESRNWRKFRNLKSQWHISSGTKCAIDSPITLYLRNLGHELYRNIDFVYEVSLLLGVFNVGSQLIIPKFSCISESPRNSPQIYCEKILWVLETVFWTNSPLLVLFPLLAVLYFSGFPVLGRNLSDMS